MWIGVQRSRYRLLTDIHHNHHHAIIINISSATAHCEPPFPAESSSMTLYPWRPSTIFESLEPRTFNHTIHPQKFSPNSAALFDFETLYYWGNFFIVSSFHDPFPQRNCCFNASDNTRRSVILWQFLIVPYYLFSFSCAGAYTLRGFSFKKNIQS